MTHKKNHSHSITIGLAGDVMLGRLVNEVLEKEGPRYVWGSMLPILRAQDINFVNLETTLTRSTEKVEKVFNFKATPEKVAALLEGNIHAVSLANNHIKDFGTTGLIETLTTLDTAGILHVGAGKNLAQAKAPIIMEKEGIRVGFLAFTDNEPGWQATETEPGINYVEVGNIEALKPSILALRPRVDILVLSAHWGPNMRLRPPKAFQSFAHDLIDLGVDIFHGHSAHIFQGIERYKNSLILYDTGDFVDDYYVTPELRNDRSFFYIVTANKEGLKKLDLVPTLISNMQVNKAPEHDARASLALIKKLSEELRTKIAPDGSRIF